MNRGLAAEAAAQLQEGINLVLSRWAALGMAVENEWGGRDSLQKSQQLGGRLFHLLTQSREQVYIDDVEDMLDEFMLSFNTEIGDGSIEEIAEKLMVMREECLDGNFESVKRLKETNVPSVAHSRMPGSNDEEDSEDDGSDDDALREDNSSEMEVDVPCSPLNLNQKDTITNEPSLKEASEGDGWTVVASRRNGGRRN
ncbi:hypothetical protein CDL12_23609 [Handroanthus impetiginosus]|uniref:Pre-rRNA-processing protein TSR2 n=1 Tax=Handroanthus impetiginosus TaxID=429701 RepID=A0A2G9GF18_9LAMI|nr:hypothetical protein CDL12_23609 [Handroanthus impetiginosus]